jgi:hypothetical protein
MTGLKKRLHSSESHGAGKDHEPAIRLRCGQFDGAGIDGSG